MVVDNKYFNYSRSVLDGKTFVFSSTKTKRKLETLIRSAGGACEVLNDDLLEDLQDGSALLMKTSEDLNPSRAMLIAIDATKKVCLFYLINI